MLKRLALAFVLMLTLPPVQAAELPASPDTQAKDNDPYDRFSLLDPATSAADRAVLLTQLRKVADDGKPWAQYLLGTLYRLGEDHPARVVPRDVDRARVYLSNAAIQGEMKAMAGMAELELESSRPLDALVWTHVYLHYHGGDGRVAGLEEGVDRMSRDMGYDASLLVRAQKKSDAVGIRADDANAAASTFIAKHDAAIHAALVGWAEAIAKESGSKDVLTLHNFGQLTSPNRSARTQTMTETTQAVFLLRFNARGEQTGLVLEDVLPRAKTASFTPLIGMAKGARANAAKEKDSKPRIARMPVTFIAEDARIYRD